jgi:hypothetical protein
MTILVMKQFSFVFLAIIMSFFQVAFVDASFDSMLMNLAATDYMLTSDDLLEIMSYSKTLVPATQVGCTPYGYVNLWVYATSGCSGQVAMEFSYPAGECVVTPPQLGSTLPSSAFLSVTSNSGTVLALTLTLYSDAACSVVKASYPVSLSLSACYSSNYLFTYTTATVPAAPGYGMLNQYVCRLCCLAIH